MFRNVYKPVIVMCAIKERKVTELSEKEAQKSAD